MLLFTACGSDDDDNKKDEPKVDALTVEKLAGLWVADYAKSATENGITWTRVVEDHLFRADGTGYYESYLLVGEKLAVAEWTRDNCSFRYTISGNAVTFSDQTGDRWTLNYADGKLTDPEEGTVYQKATTAQQTLVEWLYSEWQGMNSGEEGDDGNLNTPVTDEYTDEPARVPRH
jgi:hypothetical protein